MASRSREGILSLYCALVRPYLEPSAQERHGPVGVCPPEATKIIRGLEHLSYEKRLSWGCSAWRREGSGETLLWPVST